MKNLIYLFLVFFIFSCGPKRIPDTDLKLITSSEKGTKLYGLTDNDNNIIVPARYISYMVYKEHIFFSNKTLLPQNPEDFDGRDLIINAVVDKSGNEILMYEYKNAILSYSGDFYSRIANETIVFKTGFGFIYYSLDEKKLIGPFKNLAHSSTFFFTWSDNIIEVITKSGRILENRGDTITPLTIFCDIEDDVTGKHYLIMTSKIHNCLVYDEEGNYIQVLPRKYSLKLLQHIKSVPLPPSWRAPAFQLELYRGDCSILTKINRKYNPY